MARQYQPNNNFTPVPKIKAQPTTSKSATVARLEDQMSDLQKELSRLRSEVARLKNRVSDLERQAAPRG